MKIKPFNEKLAQLTRLLSDGKYHDGNVLGETLTITVAELSSNVVYG